MRILYHFPNEDSVYAARTIAYGYKHAFENAGHDFLFLTSKNWNQGVFSKYKPTVFITGLGKLGLKYLQLEELKKSKKHGMKVLVNVPFWNSPFGLGRLNEESSLSKNTEYIDLICSGDYGDYYFNACEQNDERMKGFTSKTGYDYHTVLLAADRYILYPEYSAKFRSDLSYIGTNIPGKRAIFKKVLFPLKHKYNTKIYGQDWTVFERFQSLVKKIGQYFNIDMFRKVGSTNNVLDIEDERKIYTSSKISLNFHESFQVKNGDLNERTYKIPLCGGFEICDNVASLHKYFDIGKDIVVASSVADWFEKVDYYMRNEKYRKKIIESGKRVVEKNHTYDNRVKQLIDIVRQ